MSRMSETPKGVMETYDWQDVAEDLQERIDKTIELINDLDIECNDDYDFYIMSSGVYCNPKIELLKTLKGDSDE